MKKLLAVALTSALGVSALGASATAYAFNQDELIIWVGSDKAYNTMSVIGQQFEEDMGIKVKVSTPEDVPSQYQQAAAIGQGPDIIFWAHDRIGGWADAGLLKKITPSEEMKQANMDKSWEGVTHKGAVYGYPVSMEAIGLVYNKDIIPEAPASFEEMIELNKTLSKQGIDTLLWDQANPYFSIPFFTANDGYVFKRDANGNYDVNDTGLNNEGAKKGGRMLSRIFETGTSPRGADFAVAEAKFAEKKAAAIIAGSWSWSNFERVGVNIGVAPLPAIDGSPARAFVGVWSALINNASPNQDVAQEFIESYILSQEGLTALNKEAPLGVTANKEFMKNRPDDERITAVYQAVNNGVLMPNVPEMGRFWESFGFALQNIISGRESSDKALDSAAKFVIWQAGLIIACK